MAKESIITALADSVEGVNHVVCNPGKVQRLAVSVLQGRLAGVEVDEGFVESCSAEEAFGGGSSNRASSTEGGGGGGGSASTISPARAFDLFMKLPGQREMSADQLRKEAARWLPENPNVRDRKGFHELVEEYIRLMGLEDK